MRGIEPWDPFWPCHCSVERILALTRIAVRNRHFPLVGSQQDRIACERANAVRLVRTLMAIACPNRLKVQGGNDLTGMVATGFLSLRIVIESGLYSKPKPHAFLTDAAEAAVTISMKRYAA